MADNSSGVSVTLVTTTTVNHVKHPEADTIRVTDGHLYVTRGGSGGDVLAIYAPTRWSHAKVETS